MSSQSERNAARNVRRRRPDRRPETRFPSRTEGGLDEWLWGWHAVTAALANPRRAPPRKLLATADQGRRLEGLLPAGVRIESADNATIARLLSPGAVHQGVALLAAPLEDVDLADFEPRRGATLLMLDQVTDPQNVGAILRSAAAFGAAGVILQDRHAPKLSGALAKAAAGAVDVIPVARVVNLSRALEMLEERGWRAIGLAGGAQRTLSEVLDGDAVVLVLGSEGDGLRPLVAEHCDELAKISMPGGFESLNVSAAAAVALYEASRPRE